MRGLLIPAARAGCGTRRAYNEKRRALNGRPFTPRTKFHTLQVPLLYTTPSTLLRCPCRPHADAASNRSLAKCLAEEAVINRLAARGELPFIK